MRSDDIESLVRESMLNVASAEGQLVKFLNGGSGYVLDSIRCHAATAWFQAHEVQAPAVAEWQKTPGVPPSAAILLLGDIMARAQAVLTKLEAIKAPPISDQIPDPPQASPPPWLMQAVHHARLAPPWTTISPNGQAEVIDMLQSTAHTHGAMQSMPTDPAYAAALAVLLKTSVWLQPGAPEAVTLP